MKQSIVYKIPYHEWKILMACGNVKQIYGLTFEEHSILEREMLLLLHDMVQKRMLCVEDDQLKPCGKYKYMLELVRKSEQFLALEYMREDSLKKGSLYLGEQLLWVENSDCRKETYEMTLISKNDWEEWILEQNFFPSYQSLPIEENWREGNEEHIEEKRFWVRICKVETGESNRELLVYEKQEKEYLRRKEKENCSFLIYHQNHLLKELKRWISDCVLS